MKGNTLLEYPLTEAERLSVAKYASDDRQTSLRTIAATFSWRRYPKGC